MSYNATYLTAKDADHFQALKGLLLTAFKDSVKIIEEGRDKNELKVQSVTPSHKPGESALTGGQKKILNQLGYKIQDRVCH